MINIADKHNCCGCNACGEACPKQAISFKTDKEGFWYPNVDTQNCIDCGLCEKVCPFMNEHSAKKPLACYAAINPDEQVRLNSSSGGVFSLLMDKIIDDGGVVFGASFDKNWNVCHTYAETHKDAEKFRGSKYVQSWAEGCFRKAEMFLKQGRKVLFSGTACQIAGLRGYLKKGYDNLFTVDVVCHGVPSSGVWSDYVETLRRPKGATDGGNTVLSSLNETHSIEGISFRDKHNGWRKFGFVVRRSSDQREDEKFGLSPVDTLITRESLHENIYMQGFLNNLFLRPSCHNCKVKCGRSGSDFSLGDFWGIWNEIPEIDDDKGISLVLVNTQKAETLINQINAKLWEVQYEQGLKYNPCLEKSVSETKWRQRFFEKYKCGNLSSVIAQIVKQMQPSQLSRVKGRIRKLGGIIRTLFN